MPLDSELAHTSIIIVMYNEELSALLRTLVSIVLNTPMDSVKEIIIVDDKSSRGIFMFLTNGLMVHHIDNTICFHNWISKGSNHDECQ